MAAPAEVVGARVRALGAVGVDLLAPGAAAPIVPQWDAPLPAAWSTGEAHGSVADQAGGRHGRWGAADCCLPGRSVRAGLGPLRTGGRDALASPYDALDGVLAPRAAPLAAAAAAGVAAAAAAHAPAPAAGDVAAGAAVEAAAAAAAGAEAEVLPPPAAAAAGPPPPDRCA